MRIRFQVLILQSAEVELALPAAMPLRSAEVIATQPVALLLRSAEVMATLPTAISLRSAEVNLTLPAAMPLRSAEVVAEALETLPAALTLRSVEVIATQPVAFPLRSAGGDSTLPVETIPLLQEEDQITQVMGTMHLATILRSWEDIIIKREILRPLIIPSARIQRLAEVLGTLPVAIALRSAEVIATQPVALPLRSVEVIATLPAAISLRSAEGSLEVQLDKTIGLQEVYGRNNDPKVTKYPMVLVWVFKEERYGQTDITQIVLDKMRSDITNFLFSKWGRTDPN